MIDLATVLTGIACLVCAATIIAQVLMTSTRNRRFPTAPRWLREGGVGLACLFIWRAAHAIFHSDALDMRTPTDGALVAVGLAAYFIAWTVYIARQNYPEGVWIAIRRLLTIADGKRPEKVVDVVETGLAATLANEGFELSPSDGMVQHGEDRARR